MRSLCNGLALCPKHSCQSLSGYYEYTFNYDSLLIEVEPVDGLWVLWQIEVEHVGLIFSLLPLGTVTLIWVALKWVTWPLLLQPRARLLTYIVLVHAAWQEWIFFLKTVIIFNALFWGLGVSVKNSYCFKSKNKNV